MFHTFDIDYVKKVATCRRCGVDVKKAMRFKKYAGCKGVPMINAGHRPKPPAPERTMPLRAGLTRCDACGKVYSNTRLNVHDDGPECRAQQVVNGYEAKGWRQVFNVTQGKILEAAGAPLEWDLGGIHMEAANAFDEYGREKKRVKPGGGGASVPVQHKVGFAPFDALRAANIMTKVNLNSEMRRRGIAALWDQPALLDELTLVVDSIKRLDGNTRAFIVQAIHDAEEKKQAAGAPAPFVDYEDPGESEEERAEREQRAANLAEIFFR